LLKQRSAFEIVGSRGISTTVGDDMNRSSLFVHGFLAGAGLVIAGLAGIAALARGARSWRRVPDAPNYAYLR
jgi:hypothetical protein